MHILINGQPVEVPAGSTLADAITQAQPSAPFAAALNREFVPRHRYASLQLRAGDTIEIIRPVTGG
jgi:sulfur carrier protein